MSNESKDVRIIAAALYHAVTGLRAWTGSTKQSRASYTAVCKQFVENVKLEQRQQSQKDT